MTTVLICPSCTLGAEIKDLFDILGTTTILDPALMSAAAHDGLRYDFAPATGNFQRLRGRPPLVSPLKSCMRRSFTAMPQNERDPPRIRTRSAKMRCVLFVSLCS